MELNSYWLSLRLSDFYGTGNVITMFTGTDSLWVWQIQSRILNSIPFVSHCRYYLTHNHSSHQWPLEFRSSYWTILISDAIDACYAFHIRIHVFRPSRSATKWYCTLYNLWILLSSSSSFYCKQFSIVNCDSLILHIWLKVVRYCTFILKISGNNQRHFGLFLFQW
jgi:hypothetical protein